MGRGARDRAREAEERRRNQLYSQIQAEVSGIPTDLTPEQKAAIRRARLGGIDIGYQGLEDQLRRRYTRIGATAGMPEVMMEVGREATREKSRAGAELEAGFAEVPVQRRALRASIYNPLYAQSTGLYGDLLRPSGSNLLGQILGTAGQVASAAILACWIGEALYGEKDLRTEVLRAWLNDRYAQGIFGGIVMRAYRRYGRYVAGRVSRSGFVRAAVTPIFRCWLAQAQHWAAEELNAIPNAV